MFWPSTFTVEPAGVTLMFMRQGPLPTTGSPPAPAPGSSGSSGGGALPAPGPSPPALPGPSPPALPAPGRAVPEEVPLAALPLAGAALPLAGAALPLAGAALPVPALPAADDPAPGISPLPLVPPAAVAPDP